VTVHEGYNAARQLMVVAKDQTTYADCRLLVDIRRKRGMINDDL